MAVEIRVKKRNHFTQCWYDGRIGETFPLIQENDGIPGSYTVDTSAIYDEFQFPYKTAFISRSDGSKIETYPECGHDSHPDSRCGEVFYLSDEEGEIECECLWRDAPEVIE